MFFNTRKNDAKEVANGIMNALRMGLFQTKHHPVPGQFELPKTIYKDTYVLGFIAGFTTNCFQGLLKGKKSWTNNHNKIGKFIFEVYQILGMNDEEIDMCAHLTLGKEFGYSAETTYLFDKGKADAQTMFGAAYGLLNDSDPDPILKEAREIAKNSPKILGTETPQSDLASAIGELTIYKYLKQTYGDQLLFDEPSHQPERSQNDELTETTSAEPDYSEERKKWENRVFRNLQLLFDIEPEKIRNELGKKYYYLDFLLDELWTDDHSSLISTLTIVDHIHCSFDFLQQDVSHFDYDDITRHYKKCRKIIELKDLDGSQIPFSESGDFLRHIDDILDTIEHLKDYNENQKTDSEKMVETIFDDHRQLLLCAEDCINDDKRTDTNPHSLTEFMFYKAKKLNTSLQKLSQFRDVNYSTALMEVLACEKSFPTETQQRIYEEIKNAGIEGLENNDVVKRLVLKDLAKIM